MFGLLRKLFGAGGGDKPETFTMANHSDEEMQAAVERARREVDSFIAELEDPTGQGHSVKAPVTDGKRVEHFWIVNISCDGSVFSGYIGNDPGHVKNVKEGDPWKVAKDEITDWMYFRADGKMKGNYTMRPLLKTMPEAQAAQYRAMLAD